MTIIARNEGKKFTPHPEGQFAAVCCDVVDLGMVKTEWQGRVTERHKIDVVFWTGEQNSDAQPLTVRERMTLSMFKEARLRKFLASWRGKPYTDQEADTGVDVELMVGVPAYLQVAHVTRDGKTYANVTSIMRLPKGMTPPAVDGYTRVKDREPQDGNATHSDQEVDDEGSDLPF